MATNRFNGLDRFHELVQDRLYSGIPASKLEELDVVGQLSESGAGSDYGANENYSGSATYFSFKATAPTAIHRLTFLAEDGSMTSGTAVDMALWLTGASALTNGIIVGVSSSSTFATNKFAFTACKTIGDFIDTAGAVVIRDKNTEDASGAGDNHDAIQVIFDFKDIFGAPIQLAKNDYIGLYLNDDLSGLSNLTGCVTGTLVYPTN